MSALPPKADMFSVEIDVRFVHKRTFACTAHVRPSELGGRAVCPTRQSIAAEAAGKEPLVVHRHAFRILELLDVFLGKRRPVHWRLVVAS